MTVTCVDATSKQWARTLKASRRDATPRRHRRSTEYPRAETAAATRSGSQPTNVIVDFTIGELARRAGVEAHTIRYNERLRLIGAPPCGEGGLRLYDRAAVDRLNFVRHARALGFQRRDIRELLAMVANPGLGGMP